VVGHAAFDHVFRIADFPERPTKIRALEHLEGGGGSAANAAVTIARLGGSVEFWSRVGADSTGRRILSGLDAEGVSTRYVLVHEGSRSSESAVIVDKSGERFIVSERDHAMPADTGWLPPYVCRNCRIGGYGGSPIGRTSLIRFGGARIGIRADISRASAATDRQWRGP